MAGLEVKIGADKTDFDKKIKEVEFDIKELSKTKLERIKLGLDTKEIDGNIKSAKASLTGLKTTLKDTGSSFDAMQRPVKDGSNTLMQFSRIAQDAPYGMTGIQNNLTATAEAFAHLSRSSGGSGNALKAVASSMTGIGGILLAVSLVTTALTYMSQNGITVGDVFKKLTGDFDGYADALKKVNEEAYKDEGVKNAISNVNELRINIDLAKKGFLNKDQVVKQYNETIGKTTGLVSSLDQAEAQLTKNAPAYIKMTLYKAAANLALEAASKQTLEAEKSRQKKLKEFTNAFLDADLTQTRSAEQYNAKQANLVRQQEKRKQKEVQINVDAANKNIDIAKKFQNDAAKIAKDFNFNLFNDNKAPSVSKTKTKPANVTPQVSGLQSSITPTGLVETSGAVLQIAKNVQGAEGMITTSMGNIRLAFDTSGQGMLEALQKFNESASNIIEGGIADTFAGLGSAIGGALASGGNVIQAAGSALLAGVGGLLTNLGTMAIQVGVGLLGIKAALKTLNPAVAIGAGVALIALGSVFSSKASALGSSSGGGSNASSGSISTGSSVSSPRSSTGSSSGGSSFQGGTVVFEISGQSLIGVLGNTLDKNRRLGGSLGF